MDFDRNRYQGEPIWYMVRHDFAKNIPRNISAG